MGTEWLSPLCLSRMIRWPEKLWHAITQYLWIIQRSICSQSVRAEQTVMQCKLVRNDRKKNWTLGYCHYPYNLVLQQLAANRLLHRFSIHIYISYPLIHSLRAQSYWHRFNILLLIALLNMSSYLIFAISRFYAHHASSWVEETHLIDYLSSRHLQEYLLVFLIGTHLPSWAYLRTTVYWPGLCSTHESWVKFDSTLTLMSRVRVESAVKIKDMSRVRVESAVKIKDMSRVRVESRWSSFESELSQLNTAWVKVE